MAKVTLTFNDEIADNGTAVQVKLDVGLDRDNEAPEIAKQILTPAMVAGKTVARLFQNDVIGNLGGYVCADMFQKARMERMAEIAQQQAEAAKATPPTDVVHDAAAAVIEGQVSPETPTENPVLSTVADAAEATPSLVEDDGSVATAAALKREADDARSADLASLAEADAISGEDKKSD